MWRNWQTRLIQNQVPEWEYEFESLHRYIEKRGFLVIRLEAPFFYGRKKHDRYL